MEQKLTTDYAIAIESLSNGTAQIGCSMGGEGYCQAKKANDAVNPLFVLSGESGTLDDALYYSFFAVREADAENYKSGDSYSIENIKEADFLWQKKKRTDERGEEEYHRRADRGI